jgi:hypothetical protein
MYGLCVLIPRGMVMNGISLIMPMYIYLTCITMESIHEINVRRLQSGVVLNSHTSLKIMNISIKWKSEYFCFRFTKLTVEYKKY